MEEDPSNTPESGEPSVVLWEIKPDMGMYSRVSLLNSSPLRLSLL